jgi:N-acetylglutamate synthase-like GNAT family acetyltransferase
MAIRKATPNDITLIKELIAAKKEERKRSAIGERSGHRC